MTDSGRHVPSRPQVALPRGSAPDSGMLKEHALREVPASMLEALFSEEVNQWYEQLGWDYSGVIASILDGLQERTISGWACHDDERAVAYCYAVNEPSRVVVGSIFASRTHRGRGLESLVLERLLAEIVDDNAAGRIECQTLFCTSPLVDATFIRRGFANRGRRYLVRDLESFRVDTRAVEGLRLVRSDDSARVGRLIFESHRGSADAALNSTYASPDQSLQFVDSIMLRSGCGHFDAEASFVAEEKGSPIGVVLVTRISRDHAHICQISVLPSMQRQGVGSALLVGALKALKRAGLRRVTLSVTAGNTLASRIYARQMFRLRRVFTSHAWSRPPGRIRVAS